MNLSIFSPYMAFRSIIFLLILVVLSPSGEPQQNQSSKISLGSSLFPTTQPTSWRSSSGWFEFGFYAQDSGFRVGIWLVGNTSKEVVWTASRDDPPIASTSTVELTVDGKLVLRNERIEKLIANVTNSAVSASILDSGNFVLYSNDSEVIWDSFDFPTDTILGGQSLPSGSELRSSLSETDRSTGRFHLKMQADGNLVLYPMNTGDTPGDAYWESLTVASGRNSQQHLYLNNTGYLAILSSSPTGFSIYKRLYSVSATNNNSIIYRATIDVDGIFRLYSHIGGSDQTLIVWESLSSPCMVNSFCGFNSYCTFNDNQPYCQCLPGTDFVEPNQKNLGCERNFSQGGCTGEKVENTDFYTIVSMGQMLWRDLPYSVETISMEDCKNSCLEDCNCGAALYVSSSCQKQRLPLRFVRRPDSSESESSTAFVKVGTRSIETENRINPDGNLPPIVITSRKAIIIILLVTIGFITSSCAALAVAGLFAYKFRILKFKRLLEYGNFGLTEELTLRLFSYNELKKATNGFTEELGKGSFGAVYKGNLYKGKRQVAVKRLEKVLEKGEREFRAEMRAIGRTHHKNLVILVGYCVEDSKRLLVYEYMSNGSLADLLYRSARRPHWNERARIAIEIARGILYLHEECDSPIIHCDIKPHNILMDDFWTAKISDFGLAKLLMPDQTRTFTEVRGTRGYMAPEWQRNTPVSVKADVYSYGIVLLEIVCCRRNLEIKVSELDQIVLSSWAYKCFAEREVKKLVGTEEGVDMTNLEDMVKVGLWCIQDEPALRPSMKTVVSMLEGDSEILIPPCPITISM